MMKNIYHAYCFGSISQAKFVPFLSNHAIEPDDVDPFAELRIQRELGRVLMGKGKKDNKDIFTQRSKGSKGGKGKSSATPAPTDCIPLGTTASPTYAKSGKGKGGKSTGTSTSKKSSGKGKGSTATPVSAMEKLEIAPPKRINVILIQNYCL